MIVSASRRTDVPTYFSPWFFNRVREGYVYVRNPVNQAQVNKIALNPDVIDGFVFWTKNPLPMLPRLSELRDYPYYFQFTLTLYGRDIERNIPDRRKVIIPAFQRLADAIGPERVIWRYDPIFLTGTYSVEYHLAAFEELAKELAPYTNKVVFSFLDLYGNVSRNMAPYGLRSLGHKEKDRIAGGISNIAHSFGLKIETCAEGIDLAAYGIGKSRCIDAELMGKISGRALRAEKDRTQRAECGCAESIDIGAYNTCRNGCAYCYANGNKEAAHMSAQKHDPESPLILGNIGPGDVVKERKIASFGETQMSLSL